MSASTPSDVTEAFEPSVETELLAIVAGAFINAAVRAGDRRLAVDFVCELAEAVQQYQDGEVVTLSPDAPSRLRVRRKAMVALRHALPGYVNRLAEDEDI